MKYLPIITLDGPAGVGKSTLAKQVASILHIAYLDTGAMFRTLALRLGPDAAKLPDEELRERCRGFRFRLEGAGEKSVLLCNGEPVGDEIRTEEVGRLASRLATSPIVRDALKSAQRALGESTSLVAEGRDMGTVVFPAARFKFFLDARGTTPRKKEYSQSHKPVLEQDEAVGHAVRATYMYAGMADVAAVSGDTSYTRAIDKIWDNIVNKKLYITGGIGARHQGEAFGNNYELPNATAYNETCAAIGNVYTNYRLFLLHGDSKYYDVLERTLYNGLISGVSIDGGSFFYPNPLASTGDYSRKPWFGCACCPSNISRFIPSLPGYIYAVKDKSLYVNLFMPNTAEVNVGGRKFTLSQATSYPWDGNITVTVDKGSGDMAMKIRIPGWVRNEVVPGDLYSYIDGEAPTYSVAVNGEAVSGELDNGYVTINRKWRKGDKVDIAFDMPVRTVKANDKVAADRGCVAVERGPIVYCAEWPDNEADIHTVLLNQRPQFKLGEHVSELGGINKISTDAQALSYDANGRLSVNNTTLTLIPYYAWAHRGEGNMAVWLPIDVSAASASAPKAAEKEDNGFFK